MRKMMSTFFIMTAGWYFLNQSKRFFYLSELFILDDYILKIDEFQLHEIDE